MNNIEWLSEKKKEPLFFEKKQTNLEISLIINSMYILYKHYSYIIYKIHRHTDTNTKIYISTERCGGKKTNKNK